MPQNRIRMFKAPKKIAPEAQSLVRIHLWHIEAGSDLEGILGGFSVGVDGSESGCKILMTYLEVYGGFRV